MLTIPTGIVITDDYTCHSSRFYSGHVMFYLFISAVDMCEMQNMRPCLFLSNDEENVQCLK